MSSIAPQTTSSAATASGSNGTMSAPPNKSFRSEVTAIWEMNVTQIEHWVLRSSAKTLTPPTLLTSEKPEQIPVIHAALWKNVHTALQSMKMVPLPPKKIEQDEDEEEEERNEPKAKRLKRDNKLKKKKRPKIPPIRYQRVDPYQVWLHIPLPQREEEEEDNHPDNGGDVAMADAAENDPDLGEDEDVIPPALGGRISQLGVAGLINAMALVSNGHVHSKNVAEPKTEANKSKVLLQIPLPDTTLSLTALQIHRLAVTWHRVIQARVRQDILVTTPLRIQDMLAADLSANEFASIRKRIYDTVVLGKGIHVNDDHGDDTLATAQASAGAVMEIEKFKKCPTCGNNDQAAFVMDRKNGDVICSNCGTVVSESLMHEGSQYRKFEGEADRNHHGDAANPLYSNAHNMSTTLSGVQASSGAGMGGWRSGGGGRNLETILRNAHDYIELNVSQLGKTDRRTRVGYKDRQKKDAFVQMGHVGDALSLHEAVVQRAKELFAGFRDDRELVVQFKGVIAACLCEAFEQLSSAGLNLMKGDDVAQNNKQQSSNGTSSGNGISDGDDGEVSGAASYSSRAARRNELHHAKLAGKGGLLLDFSNVPTANDKSVTPGSATTSGAKPDSPSATVAIQSALEEIPAATWDLEHCRSWLLEASRRIAQQWVEERSKGTAASKRIPLGTLEELEGKLVEHTFTLCEQLEDELQSRSNKTKMTGAGVNGRRVTTPRINEMGKLGIKWQHSHERGSGGKGGVGGSGTKGSSMGPERTAGQSLILKTAKKLGSMLKDPMAGEAIHKELRAVVSRQEARKLKDRRQEASRQRLQQMKRKPYLLARAQQTES